MNEGTRKPKGERMALKSRYTMCKGVKKMERRSGGRYCTSPLELVAIRSTVSEGGRRGEVGREAARRDSY